MSDIYCLQYLARPDIPIFREDLAKALFLYGAKINIERQASIALFEWLRNNGLRAFTMQRQLTWNAKTNKDKAPGTPTSPRSIQAGLELIENYFSAPNVESNENEKDNLEYFWFEETLQQCMEYDIKNKTKYDLVSSMMQTEFSSQLNKRKKIQEMGRTTVVNNASKEPTLLDYMFPVYQNGMVVTHAENGMTEPQLKRRAIV